mmetsp:Transcript_57701/g.137280  ORF Transcript_57701/g.137280 Transcript_57701/m.137280 type:complete len:504 (-) Transcript_57701:33-1544(-)
MTSHSNNAAHSRRHAGSHNRTTGSMLHAVDKDGHHKGGSEKNGVNTSSEAMQMQGKDFATALTEIQAALSQTVEDCCKELGERLDSSLEQERWQRHHELSRLRGELDELKATVMPRLREELDELKATVMQVHKVRDTEIFAAVSDLSQQVWALRGTRVETQSLVSANDMKLAPAKLAEGYEHEMVHPIMDSGSIEDNSLLAERLAVVENDLEEERRTRQSDMIQMRAWLAQFLINSAARFGEKLPPEVEASFSALSVDADGHGRRPPPPSPFQSNRHTLEEASCIPQPPQTTSVPLRVPKLATQGIMPSPASHTTSPRVEERQSPRESPRQVTQATLSPRVMTAAAPAGVSLSLTSLTCSRIEVAQNSDGCSVAQRQRAQSWVASPVAASPVLTSATPLAVRGRSPSQSPPVSQSPGHSPVRSQPAAAIPAVRSWSPVRREHTPPQPVAEAPRTRHTQGAQPKVLVRAPDLAPLPDQTKSGWPVAPHVQRSRRVLPQQGMQQR